MFPFGHGLSYTTFNYGNLELPQDTAPGGSAKISVDVENTGDRAGEWVLQLYVKAPGSSAIRTLAGFRRISLLPKEWRTIEFALEPRQLGHVNRQGAWMADSGTVEVSVGGKQPGFHGLADASPAASSKGSLESPDRQDNWSDLMWLARSWWTQRDAALQLSSVSRRCHAER